MPVRIRFKFSNHSSKAILKAVLVFHVPQSNVARGAYEEGGVDGCQVHFPLQGHGKALAAEK